MISERERRVIAYHEAGHALVAHALPTKDPVHKISIIPRGRALGYTLVLPTEDRLLRSRRELEDEMAMLLGGRTAEELGVRRSDDRRTRRHRPRHRDRPPHGHGVRHERPARADPFRGSERGGLRRPRHGPCTRVLAERRGRGSTTRSAVSSTARTRPPAPSSRRTESCSRHSRRRCRSGRRSTRPRWRNCSRVSRSGTANAIRRRGRQPSLRVIPRRRGEPERPRPGRPRPPASGGPERPGVG